MKTVRDACQLQPNALSIRLSDQIEHLDELIGAEVSWPRKIGQVAKVYSTV